MKVKTHEGRIVSENKFRNDLNDVIIELKKVRQKVYDAGLLKTYQKMDEVLKKVGWEASEILINKRR